LYLNPYKTYSFQKHQADARHWSRDYLFGHVAQSRATAFDVVFTSRHSSAQQIFAFRSLAADSVARFGAGVRSGKKRYSGSRSQPRQKER
jgi:hypothetical protein